MSISLNRRDFLAASSAAIAGTLSLPLQSCVGADERFAGLPIGIQSYSLRKFPLAEAVRHIKGLGIHHVEFYGAHLPIDASADQIADTKATLQAADIQLNAHGVNSFSGNHEANRRAFEFAKRAGIKNITANPERDSFDSLDQLCEEFGIRICIHNHGPDALYDKLTDVTSAVKDHHELIGACIDTGHVLRSDEDPIHWIRELGPRVFALHIKDVAERTKRTHDVIIGTAHLDVVEMFRALREINFPADGSLSLEYESNPDNPIDDIAQCFAVAAEAIEKASG